MVLAFQPRSLAVLLIVLALGDSGLHAKPTGLPDPSDPLAGMGVNTHFIDAQPGELEMLSRAGFRWIRTDLTWSKTEQTPGVYDFSAYDRLLASLDKFHIRALLVLDYGNGLYDEGLPPHTDTGRAAFARWAAAAVTHFKNRGVLWEIWNEPNGAFWKPRVNPEDYTKLALLTSQALQKEAPDELIVGPALNGTQLYFVDVLARAGLLGYWSAVTIHPYRRSSPETYGPTYDQARELIKRYATSEHPVELLCGESGYPSIWPDIDETIQAKYLARLFLFDVLCGIPVTIWYDWTEDGTDPQDPEHHFGIVRHDYHPDANNVFDPKLAYDAARTFSQSLDGYRFQKRMQTDSDHDFLLSFAKAGEPCLVAWTVSATPHAIKIPAPDGIYIATSFDGKIRTEVASTGGVLVLSLDDGPRYLKPQ